MQQPVAVGVGAALRKVRTSRGLSLEEASRDTRVRREFLEAIEQNDFDRLLGDVHVRPGRQQHTPAFTYVTGEQIAAMLLEAARAEHGNDLNVGELRGRQP